MKHDVTLAGFQTPQEDDVQQCYNIKEKVPTPTDGLGVIGRARLSWPEHSRSILLYTIVKYFLFERTGVGALQIDPGHDKRA